MEPRNYTITVTPEMMQIIATGLGELPAKISLNCIQEIQRQVNAQDEASKMHSVTAESELKNAQEPKGRKAA